MVQDEADQACEKGNQYYQKYEPKCFPSRRIFPFRVVGHRATRITYLFNLTSNLSPCVWKCHAGFRRKLDSEGTRLTFVQIRLSLCNTAAYFDAVVYRLLFFKI